MKCPFCAEENTKVIDSRPADDNNSIRRRRQCEKCGKRFTTYEKLETIPLVVIKKDQMREPYDRSKIERGVFRSCIKRPISVDQINELVDSVESAVFNLGEKEVESKKIGEILMDNRNILKMNPMEVRRMAGMVFQRPNPFPTMSIFDNVIAGYKLNGIRLKKKEKEEIVETCLTNVGLWNEVKDALFKKGTFLSGGQQQRLCIARALALKPEVLLMDEPTSALDPIATNRIEELLLELKKEFTIIIVTHNMSQAARISDYSMFMYLGELIEYDKTRIMFTNPRDKRTEEYLTGQFG